MTPIVLIATHERLEITTKNIRLLQKQSLKPHIILVVSHDSEYDYYQKLFPNIHLLIVANEPLGLKWQTGVQYCQNFMFDYFLVICGSDDIMHKDWCKNAQALSRLYDFAGLKQWYIYNPNDGKLYLFDYLANQPLGGGRFYTKRLLEKLNYAIFDTSKKKHLDDKGWELVKKEKIDYVIVCPFYPVKGMDILAVKGDWPVMNPLDKTFGHKNASLRATYSGIEAKEILKEKFGYE